MAVTIDSLNRISYHLQIDIPMYVIEGRTISLYFPAMSKLAAYPYHLALNAQYNRLIAHYASSVEPQMRVPYQNLMVGRRKADFQKLFDLLNQFSIPEHPLIIPMDRISDVGFSQSILKAKHNPFVHISNSDGEWLLATSVVVHDAMFRFIWEVRATEHSKRVGSSFEDEVAEYLTSKFPSSHILQHVMIRKLGSKMDQKRFELDILLKLEEALVCIECKDYALIEDPDDFKLLAHREGLLLEDCSYFGSKLSLLLRYFTDFCSKHPEFMEATRIFPAVVTNYPEHKSFLQCIPIITKYELVRLINEWKRIGYNSIQTDSDLFHKDVSSVELTYRVLAIGEGEKGETGI